MKLVIQLVLWIIIGFLGYQVFKSVYGPVEFNKERNKRYAKVIDKMKQIREAEIAYEEINGKYTGNYDSLIRFIDTAQFAITQRRDTSYADVERNKAFGLDPQEGGYYIEEVITDTLGYVSVKDSLFKDSDYNNMMRVNVAGEEIEIELNSGKVIKNDKDVSVFEAKVAKDDILHGLPNDLIVQEKQTISVDGVNGTHIRLGSLEEVTTNGNWPKQYDGSNDE